MYGEGCSGSRTDADADARVLVAPRARQETSLGKYAPSALGSVEVIVRSTSYEQAFSVGTRDGGVGKARVTQ